MTVSSCLKIKSKHTPAVIARLDRATQGGFNRSSQHFRKGGCDEEIQAFGSVCASNLAVARAASRGPAGEL
jgi:hypothetical protein